MPMCSHHHCRCLRAEEQSKMADAAEARSDHDQAARLSNEAAESHHMMVLCRLPPKEDKP